MAELVTNIETFYIHMYVCILDRVYMCMTAIIHMRVSISTHLLCEEYAIHSHLTWKLGHCIFVLEL